MIRRRTILDTLTRARLLELAKAFCVGGLSGKGKDEIAAALAADRSIKTPALLDALARDELKAVCRAADLDDTGREKAVLISRLLDKGRLLDKAPDPKDAPATSASAVQPITPPRRSQMAAKAGPGKRDIEQYEHADKTRVNNPPVGLVTPKTDPDTGQKRKIYQYDPHLDPTLVWAGKAEHTSFEVPTVSLHVHERIDPLSIIEAVRKRNGDRAAGRQVQQSFFDEPEENPPLREAIDFYKHPHGWTNRMVAGDSLLVMNSLLEKEGLAGKVQMIYIDPPYGVRYKSNFQPFVGRRNVAENDKDEDLTTEPEMVKAFRDTWELGIHSYLIALRDRLLLARSLLADSGSCFVQISTANLHLVTALLDEVFGSSNKVEVIAFRKKTMPLGGRLLEGICDYLVWYAKDKEDVKFHRLFRKSNVEGDAHWNFVELKDGSRRPMKTDEIDNHTLLPERSEVYRLVPLYPTGAFETGKYDFEFGGVVYKLPPGKSWKTPIDGMQRAGYARRLQPFNDGTTLQFVLKLSDYPVTPIDNVWADTSAPTGMRYVVETNTKVVQRCILMTTDPGDLVLDPTCGSGTTAFVAEQWGRRWITCDTSRVAITLAKQRLMTKAFDYYELAHQDEGVGSGFKYKTVPHVTLKSIANNPEIRAGMARAAIDATIARYAEQETLYDQPLVDRAKVRVTGPFTVEAVPAPAVRPIAQVVVETHDVTADKQPELPGVGPLDGQERLGFQEEVAVARFGETLRQSEWRDELLKCGIRGKSGQHIEFSRMEPLGGTRWLQCAGETRPHPGPLPKGEGGKIERVVVSFGPEHAPLEQRQVEQALEEATQLKPTPTLVVFATFQFDPEAAKDIDETNWPGVTLLKVQMNTDLLTDDLKKKRASNESYWLIGQPDVELRRIAKGEHQGLLQVEVHGFDYYNPRSGAIESGDSSRIAMWMLDTDYDGRSLFPRQVFFPLSGEKDGWARLAKNLKAEIDEELIEAYRGTASLPFAAGEYGRVAVKIVDDRGIESLKIIEVN